MTQTGQNHHNICWIYWLETRGALALGAMSLAAGIGIPAAHAQTYTVLYSFNGSGGSAPRAGLIRDAAGNLYGTTMLGGASGSGVVFKLTKSGETVLYCFTGGADGRNPYGGLVADSAGNLYGTTLHGGSSGKGVVFKLDPTGNETVLHSFTGVADGGQPLGTLIRDSAGNLYGTTTTGGVASGAIGHGTVFKVANTNLTVLYTFSGGPDGDEPEAGLLRDSSGNLYGTTFFGGSGSLTSGQGVLFKVRTDGSETVLHTFPGAAGVHPAASLIGDSTGNLYGTATGSQSGGGVVFKVDPAGHETALYVFTGGADGKSPEAGLIRDSAGNLYGTTERGGTFGAGVVFKLDPAGHQTVLHNFTGEMDGGLPTAEPDPRLCRQSLRHHH